MKHAYCIIAHGEIEVYHVLINLIDDPRNNIFVFLDKRTDIRPFINIKPKYSHIGYVNNRHNVYWAGYSLTLAEIKVLQCAYDYCEHSYYHLISGVDLPIKSQDYIHDFFKKHKGKEFIGIAGLASLPTINQRTHYYYPFQNCLSPIRCGGLNKYIAKIQNKIVKIQKWFNVRRTYSMELRMGPNWFSVTNDFVKYIIEHKHLLCREFGNIFISDEIAIQSLFWNSPYKENIYSIDNQYESCLRKIDWKRGMPYTWTINDIEELMTSEHIFARKFSSDYFDVVKEIENRLTMKK